jgi:hypothetical protein
MRIPAVILSLVFFICGKLEAAKATPVTINYGSRHDQNARSDSLTEYLTENMFYYR